MFYQPLLATGVTSLSEEESRHAARVLRVRAGDLITITDGLGSIYEARITDANASKCEFAVIKTTVVAARKYSIHIAVAPTKNMDRMEWFVEKSVELGIDEITFIECKTSERKSVNMDRIGKLVISAVKQSQQAWIPRLNPMTKLSAIYQLPASQKFIAYVDAGNPISLKAAGRQGAQYLVLIGPEGDFTAEELNDCLLAGFQKINLGPTRLRTETAALAACLTLNLINQ